MKAMLPFLLMSFYFHATFSQGVGIGTTNPHSSAQLHISSTTKGLLIPRMTTTQRFAIASPASGLMVFDTETELLYHRDGTGWRTILNSDYWTRPITIRNRIANVADSIGLGILSPTEKLDVSGNIRSSGNIRADEKINAGGTITGAALVSTGSVVALDFGSFSGNLTTYSDLVVSNAAATLQLRSDNIDKGFVQLSGDNLRLGTNSGNDLGKVVIRTKGADYFSFEATTGGTGIMRLNAGGVNVGILQGLSNNNVSLSVVNSNALLILNSQLYINSTIGKTGIGTSTPEEKLHVAGNTKITGTLESFSLSLGGGEVNRTETAGYHLLPVCYGRVRGGSLVGGTPNVVSVSLQSALGHYFQVECPQITTSSIVQVTVGGTSGGAAVVPVVEVNNGFFQVKFFSDLLEYDFGPSVAGASVAFMFVVYNP
jgi:hypothetical protein